MFAETVVDAAASAAVETPAASAASEAAAETSSFELPRSGTPEYDNWRKTGELTGTKKDSTQEASSTSTAEEGQHSENAADAETAQKKQEQRRKPDAEQRIKQLTDQAAQLKRELEEARKPKETEGAASSTAKAEEQAAQPQNYQEWRKAFKPAAWVEQYGKDNPEASYEDANAAMADHLTDVRDQFRSFEQRQQEQKKEMDTKIAGAKAKYGDDAMDVISPTVDRIIGDKAIPHSVKEMLNESDVAPHLLFTLGSDAAELEKFLAMARDTPAKAKRYLAAVEAGITEELSPGSQAQAVRNDKGQFTPQVVEPTAPAKRGPESVAEPPLEVGSRGTGTMDESQRAFQAIERGDVSATRKFLEAENRKEIARRRGA